MIELRPYQSELINNIHEAWKTHRNVMAVLPTGGGKTAKMICPKCSCDTGDTWFDRELSYPCERMMDRCNECGAGMDCVYDKPWGTMQCEQCPHNKERI